MASALPLGRRVPRGRLRWYLVACPEGREAATCEKIRAIVPTDVLEDAFVPRRERHRKVHGAWQTDVIDLFPGYFVAATKDASALSRALGSLSFPARLAGSLDGSYAPIAEDAREFLQSAMDDSHVVRLSWGELAGDELRVQLGPLAGKEARVAQVMRKRSLALVRIGESDGSAATLVLPLAIPTRR